jgi:hypothetical protein
MKRCMLDKQSCASNPSLCIAWHPTVILIGLVQPLVVADLGAWVTGTVPLFPLYGFMALPFWGRWSDCRTIGLGSCLGLDRDIVVSTLLAHMLILYSHEAYYVHGVTGGRGRREHGFWARRSIGVKAWWRGPGDEVACDYTRRCAVGIWRCPLGRSTIALLGSCEFGSCSGAAATRICTMT